jgi:hypothetical protein
MADRVKGPDAAWLGHARSACHLADARVAWRREKPSARLPALTLAVLLCQGQQAEQQSPLLAPPPRHCLPQRPGSPNVEAEILPQSLTLAMVPPIASALLHEHTLAMAELELRPPLPFPSRHPTTATATYTTAFALSRSTSCTRSPGPSIAGAPRHRRCRGLGRRRTWPGHLGPSRAKPWAPVDAPGDGDASTPLQRRRRALFRSEPRAPMTSSTSSILIRDQGP